MPTKVTLKGYRSHDKSISVIIDCPPKTSHNEKQRLAVITAISKGIALVNVELHGLDLSNIDFHGIALAGSNLYECDLTNSVLTDCCLNGANLIRANLTAANLNGVAACSASLQSANLTEANLSYADFSKSDLANAWLDNATLVSTTFAHCDLYKTRFRNSKISAINLFGASGLSMADFRDAVVIDSPDDDHLYPVEVLAAASNDVIAVLITSLTRWQAGSSSPEYQFTAFALANGEIKIMAGCRWFTIPEYRAHADGYWDLVKAKETNDILDYIEARAKP